MAILVLKKLGDFILKSIYFPLIYFPWALKHYQSAEPPLINPTTLAKV